MEHLLNENVKSSKNVYKTLKNIGFVDYTHNIPSSFQNNCVSDFPEVSFSSNFESSNLFAVMKVKISIIKKGIK